LTSSGVFTAGGGEEDGGGCGDVSGGGAGGEGGGVSGGGGGDGGDGVGGGAGVETGGAVVVRSTHSISKDVPIFVYPSLHVHCSTAILPWGEIVFAGQLLQSKRPITSLYFPLGHMEHSPPSGPEYPGSQLQSVSSVLLLGDVL